MSSHARLLAGDATASPVPSAHALDGSSEVATAPYRVPLLWLALLDPSEPPVDTDELTVYLVVTERGISRMMARAPRLAAWLGAPHIVAFAEHLSQMLADEDATTMWLDVTEIAQMSDPGELAAQVATALRWLDGDDSCAHAAHDALVAISGIEIGQPIPTLRAGLDEHVSHEEWDQVLSIVGAGDAWW